MNCPICKTAMIVLELNQIEVDNCPTCGGVWLDPDEMDLLLEGSAGRDEIRANLKFGEPSDEKARRCPLCRRKMEKSRVRRKASDAGIQIDRCKRGHGTWLDGGELDAIVATLGISRSASRPRVSASGLSRCYPRDARIVLV